MLGTALSHRLHCRYGFVNASYLHQAVFLLLSSLVLLSDRDFLHELSEVGTDMQSAVL